MSAEPPRSRRAGAHRAGLSAPPAPDDEVAVRPFVLTGGRTRPTGEALRVETLVLAVPDARAGSLRFESQRITEICREPTSLAEVAAALAVPLGVARVLVDDLVALGAITVIHPDVLSIQLIERVRDGLRAL